MFFLNSKILTALLSIFSVWILFSVISVEIEKGEARKEETALEIKIIDTKKNNELLGKYIKNFENPDFIGKEARIRLNYKAFGEEVVFVHRDLNIQKTSSSEEFSKENLSNYKKWLYRLLGF